MAVGVTDIHTVALYDTTTGEAFGPLFNSEDDAHGFLDWLKESARAEKVFRVNTDMQLVLEDPRMYNAEMLQHLVQYYRESESEA